MALLVDSRQVPVAYYLFSEPRRETLIGFHGTSQAQAATIVNGAFTPSAGDGEWLGHGVYFWDSPDAAWLWAEKHHRRSPAVVRATLVLGYCLDLDAPAGLTQFLREVYAELVAICEKERRPVPENIGHDRTLDCALLNLAARRTSRPVDSIIRTCPSGERVYPGADLLSETRRQICMRSIDLIQHPQPEYGIRR